MTGFREMVGARSVPYRFRVEEGKIAEFARSVQLTQPIFHDSASAAAEGLDGVLAPPTFTTSSAFWAPPEDSLMSGLGLDLKRVLAGGGEWEYLAPVIAGDELTVVTMLESAEEKTGSRGPMVVLRMRTEFTRNDELVQTYTNNIIQLGSIEGESA